MLRRIVLMTALMLGSQIFVFGQTVRQLPLYENETAYEVYSAILSMPEAIRLSQSKNFVIRQETLRNFGALIELQIRSQQESIAVFS